VKRLQEPLAQLAAPARRVAEPVRREPKRAPQVLPESAERCEWWAARELIPPDLAEAERRPPAQDEPGREPPAPGRPVFHETAQSAVAHRIDN
jgi:hypothetical protein